MADKQSYDLNTDKNVRQLDKLEQKLKRVDSLFQRSQRRGYVLSKMNISPKLALNDKLSDHLTRIENRLLRLNRRTFAPTLHINDYATAEIAGVEASLRALTSKRWGIQLQKVNWDSIIGSTFGQWFSNQASKTITTISSSVSVELATVQVAIGSGEKGKENQCECDHVCECNCICECNCDGGKDDGQSIGDILIDIAVDTLKELVSNKLAELIDKFLEKSKIGTLVKALTNAVLEKIGDWGKGKLQSLGETTGKWIDKGKEVAGNVVQQGKTFVQNAWDSGTKLGADVMDWGRNAYNNIPAPIRNGIDKTREFGGRVIDGGKELGNKAWKYIKNIDGSSIRNWGSDLLDNVTGKLAKGAKQLGDLAGGALKGGGKLLGKALGPLGLALDGLSILNADPGRDRAEAIGSAILSTIGGGLGALFGSAANPGVGTVVGAVTGGVAGGKAGESVGGWIFDLFYGKEEPAAGAVAQGVLPSVRNKPNVNPNPYPLMTPRNGNIIGPVGPTTPLPIPMGTGATPITPTATMQAPPVVQKEILDPSIQVNLPNGAVQLTVNQPELDYDKIASIVGMRISNSVQLAWQNTRLR